MTVFDKYNGKSNVGNTTENKGQCVGLVACYIDDLGLPHVWGDAKDLFANADEKFFEKILNTPDAIPQEGDIIVWPGKFNNGAGHTGIAMSGCTLDILKCFEQNDPIGSPCQEKDYFGNSYLIVTGWLRPIIASTNQTLIDQLRADRDKNWQLYQDQVEHSINQEDSINEKQKTIDVLTKENIDDKTTIATLTSEKQAALDEYTTSEKDLINAKNDAQSCKNALDIANGLLAHRKDLYTWSWKERFLSLFSKGA